MTTNPSILLLAIILIITACSSPPTQPTAISIPPHGSNLQTLPPDTSPTVENPILHLVIIITDNDTGQPVTADVTIDEITERAVTGLEVYVAANYPHTITVTAPGYQLRESRLNTNLHHHKRMEFTIPLQRAGDTG